jgi:elongation factor P
MKATNIRKGQVIRANNVVYRVMNMDHVTPGKGRAHIQTKLRNLKDGTQTEIRFRSDEDVERVFLETKQMQYLYDDGDGFHFMDTETYEQVALTRESLGDAVQFIVPDSVINVEWIEGNPIGVDLPAAVELKVVETTPAVKDATASAQRKPAKTETGLVVQVPAFINEGDVLKVSTLDGSYLERASK